MRINTILKFLLSVSLSLIFLINQPVVAANMPQISERHYDAKAGMKLEGEWLFFANHFYSNTEVMEHLMDGKRVSLPAKYRDTIKHTDGFGTFAIQVNLPKELVGTIQAIRIPYQHAAMDIYIDNYRVLSAGQISSEKDHYMKMPSGPFSYFEVKQESFLVVVHFSSFGALKSGFSTTIDIGDPHELMKYKQREFYIVVFLLGILILVGMFSMFIGLIDKQQRVLLVFGIFSLAVMLRCVITAPFLYTEIIMPFTITPQLAMRIEYILSLIIGYLFMYYLILLYKQLFNKYVLIFNKYIYVLTAIALLFVPSAYIQDVFSVFVAIQASLMSYLVKILIQAFKMKLKFALMNIVSVLLLASSLIFELISANNTVPPGPYVLFVLTLISVILTYDFGKFYVYQVKKLNDLNQQLFVMNNSLDELVQKRTDELTVLNIKLQNQAIMDALTGIYNRAYLNEKLEEFYKKAKQNKESLALVIFDIDEFKQYNDNNGHLKGDEILTQIVNIVKEQLPPNTIFARYGGEEFVMLFYNHKQEDVVNYCEMIRRQIEEANIEHVLSVYNRVTVSLGGTYMDENQDVLDSIDLLERADRQLYIAKRSGKNKVSFS